MAQVYKPTSMFREIFAGIWAFFLAGVTIVVALFVVLWVLSLVF